MIDLEKSYKSYEKEIKTNKKLLVGLENMLSCEKCIQYALLQCISYTGDDGIKLDTLVKFGFDKEIISIIIQEMLNNKIVSYNKKLDIICITDLGKNILLALNFRSIENLDV